MRKVYPAVALLALLVAACGCLNLRPLLVGEIEEVVVRESPRWFEWNRIALVDVEGVIGSANGLLFALAGTTAADVREKLERAADDGRVRAIVLRIDSPGGTVSESDTIYREVLRFRRETGKPVVACLMGTGTSGAYYVALAADRIVATPATVTGSVGVLIQFLNVEGLFDKLGLRSVVVKSGARKDMGSPTREMTEEEREMLGGVAREHFERFLQAVRDGRPGVTEEDVGTISDARILTADQALELHLVDQIGYLDEAIAQAQRLAGIKAADVILYRPFPHYNANIYATASAGSRNLPAGVTELLRGSGPAFLYLWWPGL
ncbi:MAG: signal peptide peptidase SppA [Candidatus Brocadiaceae bacterium]|jgi:protease-4